MQRKNNQKSKVSTPKATTLGPNGDNVIDFRMQYTAAAATSSSFYYVGLLSLLGVYKTTTAVQCIVGAVRLRSVRVWIPPVVPQSATVVVPPNVAIDVRDGPLPGFGAERRTNIVATQQGQVWKWKPRGVAGEWLNAAFAGSIPAEGYMSIVPTGCIPVVEIHAVIRLVAATTLASAQAETLTYVTAAQTAGAFVYSYLDSLSSTTAIGANAYYPIGYQSAAATSAPMSRVVTCSCPRDRSCSCGRDVPSRPAF